MQNSLCLAQVQAEPNPVAALIMLALGVFLIFSLWRVYAKAGQPGWACLIPIYNVIVLLRIAGRPAWWVLLFLVPFLNVIVAILVLIDVARSFGKGVAFGIGLVLLGFIFFPILAFSDAQYYGPHPQPLA